MTHCIVRFGFQPISHCIDKPQFASKGKLLWESGFVFNVEELKSEEQSRVIGYVERQTNKSLPSYKVILNIDKNRNLESANCECAAGESGTCKHVSAIVELVNNEESVSKTSLPREWGVPKSATAIREKYTKGRKMTEMFPIPKDKKKRSQRVYEASEPSCKKHRNITCSLTNVLFEEEKTETVRLSEDVVKHLVDSVVLLEQENLLRNVTDFIYYPHEPWSIISEFNCDYNDLFEGIIFNEEIRITPEQGVGICKQTKDQSDNKDWFTVRKFRISATKAHKINTRKKAFNEDFLNGLLESVKLKGRALENVTYGKKHEKVALEEYKSLHKATVAEVGAIVSYEQPWLCGSPDGVIVEKDGNKKLLEIKCPASCKKKPIIENDGSINVPYLTVQTYPPNLPHPSNTGIELLLKPSHQYYTQCQVLMYTLHLKECHLYIFSPIQSVLVKVKEDLPFQYSCILKLEKFYFRQFLPYFVNKYWKPKNK